VLGILLLVGAVASGSLYSVFSRKSSRHFNAFEVTYVSSLLGAFAFNAANVVRHLISGDILHYFDPLFSAENLIGFFFLAIVSSIVATGVNNFAMRYMQSSTMSAFGGVSTLTTIVVGALFMHERFYYFHAIGLTLIVARMVGVSIITIRRDRAAKRLQNDEK
jgi:drug/metabolite transporter (DMT)-like permease